MGQPYLVIATLLSPMPRMGISAQVSQRWHPPLAVVSRLSAIAGANRFIIDTIASIGYFTASIPVVEICRVMVEDAVCNKQVLRLANQARYPPASLATVGPAFDAPPENT
jgi:hypothetical protein